MADRRPRLHQILLIETEAPNCVEVRCSCDEVTWTPHGIDHAAEIGQMHIFEMLAQGTQRLPDGHRPGRMLAGPGLRRSLGSH